MLSGLITEQVFTSTTGSLKVVFISDENTTNRGFTGQYYTEPCGGNYIANGSLQNISTTNYPGNYPNNLRCAWNITSTDGEILLTIYGLHGTRSEDYVTAFNGIRSNALRYRRTSDVRHFVSRGKRMDITFSSDHRRNSFGFQASFTLIACGRNYTANSTLQYISTPNYPNNYLSGLKCSWYISSKDQQVLLTIVALNTGRGDYVTAYDEKGRGLIRTRSRRTPMNIISPSNFMRVYFDATGDTTGSGFFASYKAFTCGGTYRVTEVDQFITTPDYPNQYPRGITCNWYLQADPYKQVSILFIHHSTSGYSSSIQIYDGNHTRMGTLYRSGRNKYFSSKSSSIRVKFSSNNDGRGFNASFKIAPCGNTRDSVPQTRLIASPGYLGNYPNNANCEWTYYAARGKTIEFTIEGGELEECCDFIEVFNEDSRIARLTGLIPQQIFSSNQLRIKFISNGNVTRRGFHGIVKRGSLSSRLIASSTPQYISSPNHPNKYPNNYVYDWYISAPGSQVQFTVVVLDTERCCDQIVVYDLHGTSSSRLGDLQGRAHNVTFMSTTGQLKISFRTDSSITKSGFTAFYKKAPCERHYVATNSPQTLRYPWNDDRYGNDEDCRWTIRASDGKNIRLTILDGGSTEECCDFIEVFNGNTSLGRRSGQINKEIFESTESLLQIRFHSNANLTETGFSAEFVESPCGGWKTASNETQYFTSPNYPQHYPNNVSCGWVIVAQGQQPLEVTFEDLQIEKCCDSLEVYEYEFDRSNWKMLVTKTKVSTSYYSKSGLMKVMFTSDDSTFRRGFRAAYKIGGPCGFNATATTTPRQLSSPNFPNDYNRNSDCEWNLEASQGMQVRFEINSWLGTERCCDYLEIFDGDVSMTKLKGGHANQTIFTSTSGSLKVKFHSDSSFNDKGFSSWFMGV